MSEMNIDALKAEGWGTCPKCDWFYHQSIIERCPMCRHPWKLPVGYQQPPYESPGLE